MRCAVLTFWMHFMSSNFRAPSPPLLRPISILRKKLKHEWSGQDWVRAERFREKVETETQKSLPELLRYVVVCTPVEKFTKYEL